MSEREEAEGSGSMRKRERGAKGASGGAVVDFKWEGGKVAAMDIKWEGGKVRKR